MGLKIFDMFLKINFFSKCKLQLYSILFSVFRPGVAFKNSLVIEDSP